MSFFGLGGALLTKPTLALSQLNIDIDKDWNAKGITNLKELAASMARGDLLFFDGTRLAKLSSASIGKCLTTHEFGADPDWTSPP